MARIIRRVQQRTYGLFSRVNRALSEKGSSYSAVTGLFFVFFSLTLILDFFIPERTAFSRQLLILAFLVATSMAAWCFWRGKSLTIWAGIILVAIHCVGTAYAFGTATTFIKIAAHFQEMPMAAIYLAWFYPKNAARGIIAAYLTIVVAAGVVGPGTYLGQTSAGLYETIRLVFFTVLCVELGIRWHARIVADSQIDDLTHAITRAGLYPRVQKEIERTRRHKLPLSLVVIDVDDLKAVNDLQGHDVGDVVLTQLVTEIRNSTRRADSIFRTGGDEFVLLLPDTTRTDAQNMMLRLEADTSHPWSWGIVEYCEGDAPETLVTRADAAMYQAKNRRKARHEAHPQ